MKQQLLIHHHLLQLKLLTLLGEFCPHQIILITVFFFFCDQRDNAVNLHQCQIFSLGKRVSKMAQEIVDTKLLAKLSEGDLTATETKYHRNCLTRLFNAYRGHNTKKFRDSALEAIQGTFYYLIYNALMNNVSKWSDPFQKPCRKSYKTFKVCLTILRHCVLKR